MKMALCRFNVHMSFEWVELVLKVLRSFSEVDRFNIEFEHPDRGTES